MMNDRLVVQSEALTNFQQWATSFGAEVTKALEPLKTATATIADMWEPFREAAALLSSDDFATSLYRRKSHRHYCEVRAVKVQDLDIHGLVSNLESQWSEWTTEELEPPNEVEASSLRCNGPPSYLVYEVAHSLPNRLSGSQDKETVTV